MNTTTAIILIVAAALPYSGPIERGGVALNELKKQEQEEVKFALGISENTHDLAIAAAKANTALSYTVALRDKFLEAYKELMQIQV